MHHQNYATDMFEDKQIDNTLSVDATNDAEVQIEPWHRRVIAYADAAIGGAYTLRLPYAAMCKGKYLSVIGFITGIVAITLAAQRVGEMASQTLDTTADEVLLFSDGDEWHIINSQIA